MRVTSLDRLRLQGDLRDSRALSQRIPLILSNPARRPDFDAETQTGLDIALGDGLGRELNLIVVMLVARMQRVDHNLMTFGHVPPSVGEGDLVLGIGQRDRPIALRAIGDEMSYIYLDGFRFHPVDLIESGIGHAEEYILYAKQQQPLERHPAY